MKCFVSIVIVSTVSTGERPVQERTVGDKASKVTSYNAVPRRAFALVELMMRQWVEVRLCTKTYRESPTVRLM